MLRDYFAQTMESAMSLVEDLQREEGTAQRANEEIRTARGPRDGQRQQRAKDEQRRANEAAGKRREQLYNLGDSTTIFLFLRATQKADADAFRSVWQNNQLDVHCSEGADEALRKLYRELLACPRLTDRGLSLLPQGSFRLQFQFTLEQPYLSKDDQDFYVIDNPVRKDSVLRLPYIAPSSWKGSLRAALWQLGEREGSPVIRQLFGNEKDAEEFRAGRLQFFPTFFEKKDLEMINPQDRASGVGRRPIPLESVPEGAGGCFTLLCVPFDRAGEDWSDVRGEVADALSALARGLPALFRTYGFGGKTSSGFGGAKEEIIVGGDFFRWNAPTTPPESKEPVTTFARLEMYLTAAARAASQGRRSGAE
jgi:CRISPR/Cas system CMR subunit Cmr6 (Cas7 group RAMP superfamily)